MFKYLGRKYLSIYVGNQEKTLNKKGVSMNNLLCFIFNYEISAADHSQ